MKKLFLLAVLLGLSAPTLTIAKESTPTNLPPGVQLDESQLVEHGAYTNKAGKQVHSPAHTKSGKAPDGASAKCGDGSFSFSQNHRGTCSHHGGVAQWLN